MTIECNLSFIVVKDRVDMLNLAAFIKFCLLILQRKESAETNGDKALEKKLDLEGSSYDDVEPSDVSMARDELKVTISCKKTPAAARSIQTLIYGFCCFMWVMN